MKKKNVLIVIIIFIIGFTVYSLTNAKSQDNVELGVSEKNHLLLYFQEKYPENHVLKAGYEDINSDSIKDLVVMFKDSEEKKNRMLAILDLGDGNYFLTEKLPAPVENIDLEFKDIDDKNELEFIVSGSKNGQYGFGIYRVDSETSVMRNLFNENMENCCE